jgi:hypothetical protein
MYFDSYRAHVILGDILNLMGLKYQGIKVKIHYELANECCKIIVKSVIIMSLNST